MATIGTAAKDRIRVTDRVFATNLPDPPEAIWRDYNQGACVEQYIVELKSDLDADDFCLRELFAIEAVFLSIPMQFNLLGEFQRASGMTGYRQPASLRVQGFCAKRFWAEQDTAPGCICRQLGEGSPSAACCWTWSYSTKSQLRAS